MRGPMKRLKKGDRAHSRYKRKSNHQDGRKEVSMQRNEAYISQAGEVSTGDEVDALLERLSQLEPPASVIEQIFISIRHRPLSSRNELEEPEQKDELDISKDRLPPR
jgi:hypothetical protein